MQNRNIGKTESTSGMIFALIIERLNKKILECKEQDFKESDLALPEPTKEKLSEDQAPVTQRESGCEVLNILPESNSDDKNRNRIHYQRINL